MQNEKSCGAIVYYREKGNLQFLIVQQNVNIYWGYPKGHVIEGESEEETAIREVKEETGLSVKIHSGFRYIIEYRPRPEIIKEVVFFVGEAMNKNVSIDTIEIKSYQWVNYKEGLEKVTHDASKQLLSEAYNFIIRI